jgi:uncharacterized protein (TIGR03083 family)
MRPPEPVLVLDLFPQERAALLELLSGLTENEWELPTVCEGWSVKDVALHILGGDLGNISRRRDGFQSPGPTGGEDLVTYINRFNEEWVRAARRLSPRVVIELLGASGPALFDYFASLNMLALGGAISWAGPDRAPVWLDVAREYTERWLHQQHIRDTTGREGLTDRAFLAPVLATFVHALPHAYRFINEPSGTTIHVRIRGESGGDWLVVREAERWKLYSGAPSSDGIPTAYVDMDEATAWRLLTKGISPAHAEEAARFGGDLRLARQVLQAVAIIA